MMIRESLILLLAVLVNTALAHIYANGATATKSTAHRMVYGANMRTTKSRAHYMGYGVNAPTTKQTTLTTATTTHRPRYVYVYVKHVHVSHPPPKTSTTMAPKITRYYFTNKSPSTTRLSTTTKRTRHYYYTTKAPKFTHSTRTTKSTIKSTSTYAPRIIRYYPHYFTRRAPSTLTSRPLTSLAPITAKPSAAGVDNGIAFCSGTGSNCFRCVNCWPGGWCIKNAGSAPKCICQYGMTGDNAVFSSSSSKVNFIRADNCRKPCHYTPYLRNSQCAKTNSIHSTPSRVATTTKTPTTPHTGINRYRHHSANPKFCSDLRLKCYKCVNVCGMGGWCVRNNPGYCVCDYGWTGPEAHYVTDMRSTHPMKVRNRIKAKNCKRHCKYSPYIRNSQCASGGSYTPAITSTTTTTTTTTKKPTTTLIPRHSQNPKVCSDLGLQCYKCVNACGMGGWCVRNIPGYCVCDYGWTGPGAHYVTDMRSTHPMKVRNIIKAKNCKRHCKYSPYFRNSQCVSGGSHTPAITSTTTTTTRKPTSTPIPHHSQNPKVCSDLGLQCYKCVNACGMGGWCVRNIPGYCVCDYGWTGPGAHYVTDMRSTHPMKVRNRIKAKNCKRYCKYSPYFRNSQCVSGGSHTPAITSTTTTTTRKPTTTPIPHHSQNPKVCSDLGLQCYNCVNACGMGGWCVRNIPGYCVCDYGWTGPGAHYVTDMRSTYPMRVRNRIKAKNCKRNCNYSSYSRNPFCVGDTQPVITTTVTAPSTTTTTTTKYASYLRHRGLGYRIRSYISNTPSTSTTTTTITTTKYASYLRHRGLAYRIRSYISNTPSTSTTTTAAAATMTKSTMKTPGYGIQSHSNPPPCRKTLFVCTRCSACGYRGWCVTNHPGSVKCMCDYGYTGQDARYVPEAAPFNAQYYTVNRIRANDCNTKCAYSSTFRNPQCVS